MWCEGKVKNQDVTNQPLSSFIVGTVFLNYFMKTDAWSHKHTHKHTHTHTHLTKQLLFVLWPLLKATAQGPRKKEKPSSVLCGSIAIAQSNCTWAKKKKMHHCCAVP
jgi:hypothetical protein